MRPSTVTIQTQGSNAQAISRDFEIGTGDAAIDRTIDAMRALARDAAEHSLEVGVAALRVFEGKNAASLDLIRAAGMLYRFLASCVLYEDDPEEVEYLRHPDLMLHPIRLGETARGDCDDRATLGAALAIRAGFRPAFVVMTRRPWPAEYEHVYLALMINPHGPATRANCIPLDPQERKPLGQWHEAARERIYPV